MVARDGVPRVPSGGVAIKHTGKVEMGRTDLNGEIVLDAGRPSHGTVYCVSLTPMLPMFDDATANTIARLTPGPHTN
jgi:hypothetical protein